MGELMLPCYIRGTGSFFFFNLYACKAILRPNTLYEREQVSNYQPTKKLNIKNGSSSQAPNGLFPSIKLNDDVDP